MQMLLFASTEDFWLNGQTEERAGQHSRGKPFVVLSLLRISGIIANMKTEMLSRNQIISSLPPTQSQAICWCIHLRLSSQFAGNRNVFLPFFQSFRTVFKHGKAYSLKHEKDVAKKNKKTFFILKRTYFYLLHSIIVVQHDCLKVENDIKWLIYITCFSLLLSLLEVVMSAKIPKCNVLLSPNSFIHRCFKIRVICVFIGIIGIQQF